jgi:hypothetical protein
MQSEKERIPPSFTGQAASKVVRIAQEAFRDVAKQAQKVGKEWQRHVARLYQSQNKEEVFVSQNKSVNHFVPNLSRSASSLLVKKPSSSSYQTRLYQSWTFSDSDDEEGEPQTKPKESGSAKKEDTEVKERQEKVEVVEQSFPGDLNHIP